MALAVQIDSINANDDIVIVTGVLVPSGSYVTGGDTVDFTSITKSSQFSGPVDSIPSASAPRNFDAWSGGGNLTRAYFPIQGSAQNNSKVKMNASAGSGSELSAGAYPSDVMSDTINFAVQFKKLQ